MKIVALSVLSVIALAGSASAQDALPAGPALPGICVYNHEGTMLRSTAGLSMQAGMQRLQQSIQAELQPYEQFIQTEGTALQQGAATMPAEERQQRAQALNARIQEYQQLGQQREAQLRYTQAVQARAIAQAANPIVGAQYAARGCGILFAREATVIHANPSMDITDSVIQQLNTSLPSLSFELMTPPAEGAQ